MCFSVWLADSIVSMQRLISANVLYQFLKWMMALRDECNSFILLCVTLCYFDLVSKEAFLYVLQRTFVGECQVAYNIWPRESQSQKKPPIRLTKIINYDKCRTRPQLKRSVYLGQLCEKCQRVGHSSSSSLTKLETRNH